MTRIHVFIVSLGLMIGGLMPSLAAGPNHLKLYSTPGKYEDVKQDIEIAITNRGLVVDHTAHIGAMLDRTGKDLGTTKPIYGDAGSMQFCSAVVSRHTMEADPTNIVFCPYIIIYYTLHHDPKTVYVGYRRPLPTGSAASKKSLEEVENLLDGIVKAALNIK
ncbi:MAG: hypothetical protein NUV51_05260 [Sulfuricaulis sp.]|nr:hypothetical protein [Sulfuricaulis sp.]